MNEAKCWTVVIDIGEHDGSTRAVARLHTRRLSPNPGGSGPMLLRQRAVRPGPRRRGRCRFSQIAPGPNGGGSSPGTVGRPLIPWGMIRIHRPYSPGAHGRTPLARVRSTSSARWALVTSSAGLRTSTLQPLRVPPVDLVDLKGHVRVPESFVPGCVRMTITVPVERVVDRKISG